MADVPIDFEGKFDDVIAGLDDLLEEMRSQSEIMQDALNHAFSPLEQVPNELDSISIRATAMATVFSAVTRAAEVLVAGIRAAVDHMREWVDTAAEAEQVDLRLALAIRAAGEGFEFTTEQVAAQASALQKLSTQGDEAIKQAQSTLIRLGLQNEQFERASRLTVELSEAMGQDLTSAAYMLGRALERPETAMMMLRRAGISFNEQEKETIKLLIESGDRLRAQEVLLGALEARLLGSGEVMRGSYVGGWKALSEVIGDVKEDLGVGVIAVINDIAKSLAGLDSTVGSTGSTLADTLDSLRPKIDDFFEGIKTALIATGVAITVMVERSITAFKELVLQVKYDYHELKQLLVGGQSATLLRTGLQLDAVKEQRANRGSLVQEVLSRTAAAMAAANSSGSGGLGDVNAPGLPNMNSGFGLIGVPGFADPMNAKNIQNMMSTLGFMNTLKSFGQGISNLGGALFGAGENALGVAGEFAGGLVPQGNRGFRAQFDSADSLFKRIQASAASIDDDPQKKTAENTKKIADTAEKTQISLESVDKGIQTLGTKIGQGIASILQ